MVLLWSFRGIRLPVIDCLCKHTPMVHQQQLMQSNACTKDTAVLPAGIEHMCCECGVNLLIVYMRLVQIVANKAMTTAPVDTYLQ